MQQVSYQQLEDQVLEAHNQIRQDPKSFIPQLQERLKHFKNNIYKPPGETVGLMTNEGTAAVEECIQSLQAQQPLGQVKNNDLLKNAARDHAQDIGPKGITGHNGSDGSTMQSRIKKYGQYNGYIGENIDFGRFKNGAQVISDLIIDDGVSSRGHRTNIFNSNFNLVGISIFEHQKYGMCCVLDYATEITPVSANTHQQHQNQQFPQQNHQFQQQAGQTQHQQMQAVQQHHGQGENEQNVVGTQTQTSTQTEIHGNQKKVTTVTQTTYTYSNGSTKTVTQTSTQTSSI